MASISGITAMLSLRGKIPVSTIVARGALRRQRSTMAFRPFVTSATLSAVFPDAAGTLPTLLVPARITITFGIDAIELAVLQPPEDVLRAVGAPAEVARVPAGERRLPVGEEVRIVGRAPAPRDRVADEVDVDPPLRPLREQLLVGEARVGVGAGHREIRRPGPRPPDAVAPVGVRASRVGAEHARVGVEPHVALRRQREQRQLAGERLDPLERLGLAGRAGAQRQRPVGAHRDQAALALQRHAPQPAIEDGEPRAGAGADLDGVARGRPASAAAALLVPVPGPPARSGVRTGSGSSARADWARGRRSRRSRRIPRRCRRRTANSARPGTSSAGTPAGTDRRSAGRSSRPCCS